MSASTGRDGLSLDVLTSCHALAGIAQEWAALDAALPVRTPFTSPAWNLLWWEHFRRDSVLVVDSLHVAVIRDAGGILVAIAPMMVTHRPGWPPAVLRELQFFGADPNLTELRGLVCRPTDMPAVLSALMQHVAGQAPGLDWIRWHGLSDAVPRAAWPPLLHSRDTTAHHLHLCGDEVQQVMPRNLRDVLRKSRNALRRDGIAWTVDRITQPAELEAAVQRLYTLQARRAALPGAVGHADPFASATARNFLAAYVADATQDGACMFALSVNGEWVALRLGFAYGHELYLYYSAHDPAWRRYGVGTLVDAAAVEWAAGQGMGRVNLSTGSDLSKTRWHPAATTVTEGFQVISPARGRLGLAAIEHLRHRRMRQDSAA